MHMYVGKSARYRQQQRLVLVACTNKGCAGAVANILRKHMCAVAPNLRPVSHNSGSSAIAWMDRNALVALYHSTGGADCWRNSENWDSEDDVSTWYGVKVDDEGRVVALHLGHNNLAGKIF